MFNGVTQKISQERFYVQVGPQSVSGSFCQRHQNKTPLFLAAKRRQIVVRTPVRKEAVDFEKKKAFPALTSRQTTVFLHTQKKDIISEIEGSKMQTKD